MWACNFLMAAAILITPPEVLDPAPAARWHADLAPAMQYLAIQWEVLDPREHRSILAREADFVGDVKVLQDRLRDMNGVPFVEEARRFPARRLIEDLLAFNRSYRNDLSARLVLDVIHAEELKAASAEAEHLHRVWATARDARCEYYYVLVRRQALRDLRALIGPEAFYSGRLPPAVPVWRIPEGD